MDSVNSRLGGLAQNRTGMQGFAVLCVTIPPRGLNSRETLFTPYRIRSAYGAWQVPVRED
jgi:hypothetical protein